MDYYTTYPSPLGELTLASDGIALTGLWIKGQKYFGSGVESWEEKGDIPGVLLCWNWIMLDFLLFSLSYLLKFSLLGYQHVD